MICNQNFTKNRFCLRNRHLSSLVFILIGFFVLTANSGCHSSNSADTGEKSGVRVIQMPEMSKEIKLPTKLWDLVTGASFEKSVQESSNFIFAPIKVTLEEKASGVLTEPVVRLEFPKAGGEVDFSKYVKNDRGTFKISFQFDGFSDAENLKVYYVSRARKRKIDNQIYGSGCREFFDVKDFVKKVNEKDGLVVNVTRDRHDSAVGGHFLFSYKKEKQTFVSHRTRSHQSSNAARCRSP